MPASAIPTRARRRAVQFSATRIDGSNISPPFPGDTLHSRTDFIGTIAGRVGVAWDRTLLYAKGGGAWVHDKYWEVDSAGAFSPVGTVFAEADEVRWGWMVGAGIEHAFAPNWSAKVEYNYLDLGTRRLAFSLTVANQSAFEEDIHQAIRIILGTNHGERVMRPDFGAGLREFIFEPLNVTTCRKVKTRVNEAIAEWEPRIDVESVDVRIDGTVRNLLHIAMTYRLRSTNTLHNLVYPFYLEEGSAK